MKTDTLTPIDAALAKGLHVLALVTEEGSSLVSTHATRRSASGAQFHALALALLDDIDLHYEVLSPRKTRTRRSTK